MLEVLIIGLIVVAIVVLIVIAVVASIGSRGPAGGAPYVSGMPPGPPSTTMYPSAAVLALIALGNKIGAIKQYRMETGAGLKEAKDAVEAFERGLR